MGKGDGKWGKKGDGLGPGGPGVGPGAAAWKGLAKWGGKGDKSEKGNWISQPEDGPELKRPRMDAMGPEFSLKGRDGGKGLGKGLAPGLAKGQMVPPGLPMGAMPGGKGRLSEAAVKTFSAAMESPPNRPLLQAQSRSSWTWWVLASAGSF